MRTRTWIRAHRGFATAMFAATIALIGLGVYWFAPQNLILDRRVDEALPGLREGPDGGEPEGGDREGLGEQPPSTEVAGPVIASRGAFSSLEHATTGSALVVRLEDGSHLVRLEELETSNGPDLRVLLSDQPPSDDWHGWADGEYVDLGGLKGNVGSSNYEIPSDVDPANYRTVVVWCRRFTVGFGVAPIWAR